MIPKELFKKIRRIEITTNRMVTDVFAGQYHSVFKGQGIEFDEVREYQHGDDVRSIDWNVTARTGKPHVKKFIEEREMTVMLLVDASASSRFGTRNQLKSSLAAEMAAVLAFSAIRNNDKVGVIIFTDKIEKFIPPHKGTSHVLRVIREILYFSPQGKQTDISQALDYLNKVTTRKSVCFLISDFMEFDGIDREILFPFQKALRIAQKRHDMIGVCLNDPGERVFPDAGIVAVKDAESGRELYLDSSDGRVRKKFEQRVAKFVNGRDQMFRSLGMDALNVFTDQSFEKELVKFFKKRKKKLARSR